MLGSVNIQKSEVEEALFKLRHLAATGSLNIADNNIDVLKTLLAHINRLSAVLNVFAVAYVEANRENAKPKVCDDAFRLAALVMFKE